MFLLNLLFGYALDLTIRSKTPLENMTSANFIQDSTVEDGKHILSFGTMRITCNSSQEVFQMQEAFKDAIEAPKNFSSIITEASQHVRSFESDMKSGAFNAITIFTDKEEHIKQIKDISLPKNCKLLVSSDKSTAESLKCPFPGVYGYNCIDHNGFGMEFPEDLKTSISAIVIPSFSKISQDNFADFRTLTQKIVYFITEKESFESSLEKFGEKSKKFASEAKIVYFTPSDVPSLIKVAKILEEDYPLILSLENDVKMIVKKITEANFVESVDSILKNKAEKIRFSSEIPEDNESRAIKVINSDTLESIKKDSSVDKIILFSSPNCHHCVSLEPVFKSFANALQEKNVSIYIGQYNVIENEPAETSVPVIYFKKQGSEELVNISTKRTLKALLEHLAETGVSAKINIEDFNDLLAVGAKKEKEIEEEEDESEESHDHEGHNHEGHNHEEL